MNYLVRQYRPAYVSGYENAVFKDVPYDKITSMPFCENFKHSGFKEFVIETYSDDELIVSAHYDNGEHWVVAFALPENSNDMSPNGDLLRDNWRYKIK